MKDASNKKKSDSIQLVKKSVTKKSSNNDDTDEMDSDSDKAIAKAVAFSVKNDPSKNTPKTTTTPIANNKQTTPKKSKTPTNPASAANAASTTTDSTSQVQAPVVIKKRRLDKVISNRHLQVNTKVTLFNDDPFFEKVYEGSPLPYISPSVQSKLAFRAIFLDDMRALKDLIDDVDKVPSVHIGRSLYVTYTPAQYALQLGNRKAMEMLLDDFLKGSAQKKRVQIPDTMLEKFSNGVFNPRSLGGTQFVRKLTESRGAKEGNQAFTKDQILLKYVKIANKLVF